MAKWERYALQVHLVSVEIGVVRRRATREERANRIVSLSLRVCERQSEARRDVHGKIEPEGRVRHDLDPMAHHRHLVQRRLPVEQHKVTVLEVPLDDPAVLERDGPLLVVPQVDPLSSVADDVPRSGVVVRSLVDEFLEVLNVVRRDWED